MSGKTISGFILGGVCVLGVVFTVFGGFYTVDQRQRAVVLRNGKMTGVSMPGLSLKMPWIDSVVKVSLETHKITFTDVNSYSQDQQPAKITVSVNYRVTETGVGDLYTKYGSLEQYADRILRPRVQADSKIVFGQYTAVTAIQNRAKLNQDIQQSIINGIGGANSSVIVEAINIENIDFSHAYESSIEQRMLAEVEVQRLRQNAEREKVQGDITVTQATARANAVRQEAQASADAIRLKGEAEADAIKARATALASNSNLVNLIQAEKWDGKLPTTMVPGSAVPFLNVNH